MSGTSFVSTAASAATTDTFSWVNQYGGVWGTASNWLDTMIGAVAASPPSTANAVSITGASGGNFTNIVGNAAVGQVSIAQNVLLWGTVTVGGPLILGGGPTGSELDLDGGASVSASSLSLANGTTLQAADSSTLTVAGPAVLTDGFLLAASASTIQLGGLVANGFTSPNGPAYGTIAVDDTAAIEIGTAGGPAAGAVTIDRGQSAAVSGAIQGNVVVNGTLAVQAGSQLSIDVTDPFGTAQSIGGTGTLTVNESSQLTLGVADSAAIQFAGPMGTLALTAMPTGTISGFAAGDLIELSGLATGLGFSQTSPGLATLTLTKAFRTVGTLTLAGNYTGGLFHLRLDSAGRAFISLQTIGFPPIQPTVITGSSGSDILNATANNQTLTGRGGNDALIGGTFTGIDFKDTSADLNGSTIASFAVSDQIDLTDMNPATATVTFTPAIYSPSAPPVPATLAVTDGTHNATVSIALAGLPPVGAWSASADGSGGTVVKFAAINTDAYVFVPPAGCNYGIASNWRDATTSATAALAPGYGNAVTLTGGTGFTDVTGTGVAASLTTSGSVLLLGNLNVGAVVAGVSGALTQTGTLALDGANLVLAGSAAIGGTIEGGGVSRLTVLGNTAFTGNAASLLALDGTLLRFSTVAATSPSMLGFMTIDASSAIEFGTLGSPAAGALTIDSGVTANLAGTINASVVVNGTLTASGRLLALDGFGPVAPTVSGTGTLEIDNGGTLALAGADSAAVLFTPSGGTLMTGGSLPTGTITGFSQGDAIVLARSVTGFSYAQTAAASGTLTLLNDGAVAGTLALAGVYTAQQFQLRIAPSGTSATIGYAAAPSSVLGNQVATGSDLYAWTNTGGGDWSYAGNWADTTTGTAAVTAPGAGNAVVIQDNPGQSAAQIVTGSGSAAALRLYGAGGTTFTGTLAVTGSFYIATAAPSGVTLAGGAQFSVGTLSDYGILTMTGGSVLTVTGSSGGTEVVGNWVVAGGSRVTAIGGFDIGGGILGVDGLSIFEYGAAGGTATGTLTIDAGQTVTMEENGAIAANLVVNGMLIVDNGTIGGFGGSAGTIGGSGTIQIGGIVAPGRLTLRAADSAALVFAQGSNMLEVQGALPVGTIGGFVAGDTIQLDRTVTGVSFVQTTASLGVLTLTDGAATIGTLNILGNDPTRRFQAQVAAATGFATISLAALASNIASAAADTGNDAFNWTGGSSGSWDSAANWMDTTANAAPLTVPNRGNAVTIAGNSTIGGSGLAFRLAIAGNVLLTGQFGVVSLAAIGTMALPASLALAGGARITANSAVISGGLTIGGGSSATIDGNATLAGGSLLVLDGSSVLLGGLAGTGSGNVVAVDANSVLRIGVAAQALAGALTQAAGTSLALSGSIYGNVVANGIIAVAGGGTLFIDMTGTAKSDPYGNAPSIGGSGLLSITEGATLALGATDSTAIQFAGPNGTLALATLPTATITGFAAGDQIQLDQTVTGVSYTQLSSSIGALTLTNGAAMVGTLTLAGSYPASSGKFHLDTTPDGSIATISLQTLGIATSPPTLIQGTQAADLLTPTANGQTLTGGGGIDTLNVGGFSSIAFKDSTANINSYTIQGFNTSDWIDFTDMNAATAWVRYARGVVSISDGVHSANFYLAFDMMPASGGFSITSDGASGSKVMW